MKNISVVKVSMGGNEKFNLNYSVVQDNDDMYGIEIQKKFSGSTYSERAVKMLSCTKEDVLKLADKLARCKVTPLTLDYIIEDLS